MERARERPCAFYEKPSASSMVLRATLVYNWSDDEHGGFPEAQKHLEADGPKPRSWESLTASYEPLDTSNHLSGV